MKGISAFLSLLIAFFSLKRENNWSPRNSMEIELIGAEGRRQLLQRREGRRQATNPINCWPTMPQLMDGCAAGAALFSLLNQQSNSNSSNQKSKCLCFVWWMNGLLLMRERKQPTIRQINLTNQPIHSTSIHKVKLICGIGVDWWWIEWRLPLLFFIVHSQILQICSFLNTKRALQLVISLYFFIQLILKSWNGKK